MPIQLQLLGGVAAALLVAALVSFITTPVVKAFAQKVGAIDVPKDGRRMHDHPIARMGGLAIVLGFMLSVILFVDITKPMQGMLLGGVIIVVLGIFDDIYNLPAMFKFVVQIVAALVAVLSGNVISVLSNPNVFSANPYWDLGALAIP
ncbi:MAG: undecaprenyl/decaprenyl-phosphate alpha-N-acetylglucosaminyl 1-phosphate transferase, partial [Oscillospiraceae bacterium]